MDTNTQSQVPKWLSITGQPLELDATQGFIGKCSSISNFEKLNQLGEGTYGVVSRARDLRTSRIVALKQIRIDARERYNGIPITALREIGILRSVNHTNIVNVIDVAVGQENHASSSDDTQHERADVMLDEIYMVMEYAEQDLANLLDELNVNFSLSEVKCLFRQVLEGLEYLHRNDIIHRDLKLQNLLLTSKGILKIADFGMAREYSPRPLTPGVVTIWYRSPELLLGARHYSRSVDMWSAGTVLAELILSEPVLAGEQELEQLSLIVKLLGTPTPTDLAAFHDMGCPDLMSWQRDALPHGRANNLERRFLTRSTHLTVAYLAGLLTWDPRARWTAKEALGGRTSSSHEHATVADRWWRESPRGVDPSLLPTFPDVRSGVGGGGRREAGEAKHKRETVNKEDSGDDTKMGYLFDFNDDLDSHRQSQRDDSQRHSSGGGGGSGYHQNRHGEGQRRERRREGGKDGGSGSKRHKAR